MKEHCDMNPIPLHHWGDLDDEYFGISDTEILEIQALRAKPVINVLS